jgi:hypothetical protein
MREVKITNNLLLKIRLSILWIFIAVAGYRCTSFMDEGIVERIIAGELDAYMTAGMLLFVAVFWLIPFLMAFLTVTLENKANRWANIVVGVVFVVLNLYHFVEHALEPTVHQLVIVGGTVIAALLIVYYAWKWPE